MELFIAYKDHYQCNFGFCRKRTLTLKDAISHGNTHNTKGLYCCKFCSYTSNVLSLYKEHEQRHVKKYLFNCSICGYGAVRMTELKKHNSRHLKQGNHDKVKKGRPVGSGKKKKVDNIINCKYDNCSYQTRSTEDLSSHIKTHINPINGHNIAERAFIPKPRRVDMMQILMVVAIQEDESSSLIEQKDTIDVEEFDPISTIDVLGTEQSSDISSHYEREDIKLIKVMNDSSAKESEDSEDSDDSDYTG